MNISRSFKLLRFLKGGFLPRHGKKKATPDGVAF